MTIDKMGPPPGFGMVPAWLAWKQPSGNAVLVYVHLALFGTFNTGYQVYEQCKPSVKTLSNGGHLKAKTGYPGTGLSTATVERALKELRDLGAAIGIPQYDPATGAQMPTVYQLVHNRPAMHPTSQVMDPHITDDGGPHITDDAPPPSPVMDNQDPSTQNDFDLEKETISLSASVPAPRSSGSTTEERDSTTTKSNTPAQADVVAQAVALARTERPAWSVPLVQDVVRAELVHRAPAVVAAAWSFCLADRLTTSPRRFREAGPWWDRAINAQDARSSAPAAAKLPWCGACDPEGRMVELPDGRVAKCPDCNQNAGTIGGRQAATIPADPRLSALVNTFAG